MKAPALFLEMPHSTQLSQWFFPLAVYQTLLSGCIQSLCSLGLLFLSEMSTNDIIVSKRQRTDSGLSLRMCTNCIWMCTMCTCAQEMCTNCVSAHAHKKEDAVIFPGQRNQRELAKGACFPLLPQGKLQLIRKKVGAWKNANEVVHYSGENVTKGYHISYPDQNRILMKVKGC